MKTVTVLRGISGSGKSTFTKKNHPNAVVCSADNFFIDKEGNYNFDPRKLSEAHRYCMSTFLTALEEGKEDVVVDNTNIRLWEASPYISVAAAKGYTVKVVRFNVPAKLAAFRNVHQVPSATVHRMIKDFERGLPWWNEETIDTSDV